MIMMSKNILAAAAMVGLTTFGAQAENSIQLKNGRTMTGKTIEWREGTQEYILATADTTLPIPRAQVARVTVDRPAEFDQAATMVKSRLFGQAIPILEGIVKKYRMLTWDAEAGKLLAQAYLETNEPRKAMAAMDALFASVSRDQVPASLQMMYWKAMLSTGAHMQLRKELDKVIGSAASDTAAAAYLMRGNLSLKLGDEDEALADFLKVTTLFQSMKALQPEALFNAANLLDAARDPRGADMRKQLVQEYAGNEFAAKAAAMPKLSGPLLKPATPAPAPATRQ
jgi:hypothetical protein